MLAPNSGAASFPLVSEGMPYLSVWANQLSPIVAGAGATVVLQYMVRASTAGDDTSDEWLVLGPVIALAPGVPNVILGGAVPFVFPATKIRLFAIGAQGAGATAIDYVLGANA